MSTLPSPRDPDWITPFPLTEGQKEKILALNAKYERRIDGDRCQVLDGICNCGDKPWRCPYMFPLLMYCIRMMFMLRRFEKEQLLIDKKKEQI